MNILVTGGAGFIGSHVVDAYIKGGHKVIIVDDLSTGRKQNLNPKAVFYEGDIRDEKLAEVFDKHDIDIVNHHAAQINVRTSVTDPSKDADINIKGLLNVLKLSAEHKVKKFIFVSSGGAIYSEENDLPIKETGKIAPKSPYGISKYAGEMYVRFYSEVYGLNYVILRYSNVYGERQDPRGEAGVISIFLDKIKHNESPEIFGSGEQTRDYVYVKDVVKANVLVLNKGDGEAFNIATSKETSVNELFNMIRKERDSKLNAVHTKAIPGELQRNSLDITKAKTILGWHPDVDLKKGIIN